MSKLSKLKTELATLKRATGVDAKGSPDSFEDSMVPEVEGVDLEEFYGTAGMPDNKQEAVFCFGKDVNNWPKAVRQRFNV